LNRKQQVFINLYTALGTETFCNAAKSARMAGYSNRTSATASSYLLKKPKIAEIVKKRLTEIEESYRLDPERLKKEIGKIVYDGDVALRDKLKGIEIGAKVLGLYSDAPIQKTALFQTIDREVSKRLPQLNAPQQDEKLT